MKKISLFVLIVTLVIPSFAFTGKWEVWNQEPDFEGIGVSSQDALDYQCQAADDWFSEFGVPLYTVIWYGGWWYDTDFLSVHACYWNDSPTFYTIDEDVTFVIQFWSNDSEGDYDKPDELLWSHSFGLTELEYGLSYQEPSSGKSIYWFQYDFFKTEFEPEIDVPYWISIYAQSYDYVADYALTPWSPQWFWQESDDHWNEYAVGRYWWWDDDDWNFWGNALDSPQPEDVSLAFYIDDCGMQVQNCSIGGVKALFH